METGSDYIDNLWMNCSPLRRRLFNNLIMDVTINLNTTKSCVLQYAKGESEITFLPKFLLDTEMVMRIRGLPHAERFRSSREKEQVAIRFMDFLVLKERSKQEALDFIILESPNVIRNTTQYLRMWSISSLVWEQETY